jgi:hypothetical protein
MTTTNNSQFEKDLNSLRKTSLSPDEKGKMFGSLLRYAETHPAKAKVEVIPLWMRLYKKALLFIK